MSDPMVCEGSVGGSAGGGGAGLSVAAVDSG